MRTWLALAAHYGEYILHPVESHLQCSCPVFDCGSFEVQKQSVSNAFQYVVLHPSAPSSSDDIVAKQADAAAKIQISGDKTKQNWKFLNLFDILTVTVTAVTISTMALTANAEPY